MILVEANPLAGLAGGTLIGLSTATMLLGAGRIAGVSGIAARSFGLGSGNLPRLAGWAFLAGLPLGAAVVHWWIDDANHRLAPLPVLVAAGLLVGFGSRLGSGCTSGHGVCGVSRLSRRSFLATALFMLSGMIAVAVSNALGLSW